MELKVGSLVRVLINVNLLNGEKIYKGDVGIVTRDDIQAEECLYNKYEYSVLVSGHEIFVFKEEIEIIQNPEAQNEKSNN